MFLSNANGKFGTTLCMLPEPAAKGGLAIYEFRDGQMLSGSELTFPQPQRGYYQLGDVIQLTKMQPRVVQKYLGSMSNSFPRQDIMIDLANAFGVTQLGGSLITEMVPSSGIRDAWVGMEKVLFFGNRVVPTGANDSKSLSTLAGDIGMQRQTKNWSTVLVPIAKFITDISLSMVTANIAGGGVKLIRNGVLKKTRRIFEKRAGAVLLSNWLQKEIEVKGVAAANAFLEAFIKTFAEEYFKGQVALAANVVVSKVPEKMVNRAIVAGCVAFLSALLTGLGKSMNIKYKKAVPKRYTIEGNPAEWRVWILTIMMERLISSSTKFADLLVGAGHKAYKKRAESGEEKPYTSFLEDEISKSLPFKLEEDLSESLLKLLVEVIKTGIRDSVKLGGEVLTADQN